MKDAFQTENYARFMEKYGWIPEWRRGNLFLKKTLFGFTFEECAVPCMEISPSDFKGTYCQLRCSDWKLPEPFRSDWTTTLRVNLTRPLEEIFMSLDGDARRGIRQAQKRGTWFKEGTPDDFDTFWRIYEDTSRRQSFPTRSHTLLLDYLKSDFCKLFLVGISENIAGAYLVVEGEGISRYFYGGFLYEYRKFKPNNLGHWGIIEYYHKKGFQMYDMGGAGKEPQTTFKSGFGQPVTVWHAIKASWLAKMAVSLRRRLGE